MSEAPQLRVFVIGPGVGESIVVLFPDDRALVMDVCTRDGDCLTVQLLQDLGVENVDLLVVSHPDLDHIRGLPQLVEEYPPGEVWRYPYGGMRDFVAQMCNDEKKYGDLRSAYACLDQLLVDTGNVIDGGARLSPWPAPATTYEVKCLAPTHHDAAAARKVIKTLEKKRNKRAIEEYFDRLNDGTAPRVDGNVLSLAVVVRWHGHHILLGGDVECGAKSPNSGWKGVIGNLQRRDELDWITNTAAVKVAHHGSSGAFERLAWEMHAQDRKPVALIAPYSPSGLPVPEMLVLLSDFASEVHVSTATANTKQQLTRTGWNPQSNNLGSALPAGTIEVRFSTSGDLEVFHGPDTAWART